MKESLSTDTNELTRQMLEEIEQALKHCLDSVFTVEPLKSALLHAVFPAGKRIRPLLSLVFCHELGGNWQKLCPLAISLELLHCSSLVHDDLPAMDDDDMRRGKPSCHKAFGEATAILAGDFLVGRALSQLNETDFDAETRACLMYELSQTYLSLCNGQQLDINADTKGRDLAQIHKLKTGALFSASFKFGAIAAGASESVVQSSAKLGDLIGLAFQIRDDHLDLFSSKKGREGGSDLRNQKSTFLNSSESRDFSGLSLELSGKIERAIDEIRKLAQDKDIASNAGSFNFALSKSLVAKIIKLPLESSNPLGLAGGY